MKYAFKDLTVSRIAMPSFLPQLRAGLVARLTDRASPASEKAKPANESAARACEAALRGREAIATSQLPRCLLESSAIAMRTRRRVM